MEDHALAEAATDHPRLHRLAEALDDHYGRLPARFYTRVAPTPVSGPRLIKFNSPLAAELRLPVDGLGVDDLAAVFSGNLVLPGTLPLAMVYAGHQFGQFVPQLGDGRAILLGDVRSREGALLDVQLKGSGRTPYSRSGDGRAALGPVIREYLVSEAMHALGIPATRALAVVSTGEAVFREGRVPGAILTRVAASHVRVGTFQFFAAAGDVEATRILADFVIERHYPEARASANPVLDLLRSVVGRQARLVAAWMQMGFIHGVMNTDNMAVSGETIDFGPCAFMDAYDPATVFSSIDHRGRYAYVNQPAAAQWNLARFAETLLPHIDLVPERAIELATAAVSAFAADFDGHWLAGMRRKLGLFLEEEGDAELAKRLLDVMHQSGADFTRTFRWLCTAVESAAADADMGLAPPLTEGWRAWLGEWRVRLGREPQPASEQAALMRLVNPAVIPRNHQVERAIVAAVEHDDYAVFEELSAVLSRPFEERAEFAAYRDAPRAEERVLATFCGT